ncbi:hypothetical protein GPECTOR_14g39 [Gonium pectorale]|uniref:Uncharacterized protein n=1 Tax=Gonium pectorale TaxID=33097 RepID=A0A150GMU5_GONPE|nr:hypothetical protein GPECTOR_14g39 [Gonium pectorale]|eukprot:KXZ51052.1 hypothetical protein GPECTOR_14g39 [Gonium pectorale]
MWSLNNITKLVTEQAGSVIKEAGLDSTLNSAKQQLTGQLDKLASSVLVLEPGQAAKPAASDALGELEDAKEELGREQSSRLAAERRLEAIQGELEQAIRMAGQGSGSSEDQEELRRLKDALEASQTQAKTMEAKGRRQYQLLMATKQQLTELETQHLELQAKHTALEQAAQEAQRKLLQLEAEAEQLRRGVESSASGDKAAAQVGTAQQLEELQRGLHQRDERLVQLEAELQGHHANAAALAIAEASKASEVDHAAEALRQQLDAALGDLRKAEEQLSEAAQLRAELGRQHQALQERGVALEREAKRAADAEASRQEAEGRAAAAAVEAEDLQQRLAAEEARHRRQTDELIDTVEELRRQLDVQARAASSGSEMAQRLTVAVGQLESAAALYESSMASSSSFATGLDELLEELANLSGKQSACTRAASPSRPAEAAANGVKPCAGPADAQTHARRRSSGTGSMKPLADAEQELERLRGEVAKLKVCAESATQLRNQLAGRDVELHDWRQRAQRAEQERASAEERLQRLTAQLREAREARDDAGAAAEEARRRAAAELAVAEQRIRELESQLSTSAARVEHGAAEVEALRSRAEEAEVAAAEAARALASLREEAEAANKAAEARYRGLADEKAFLKADVGRLEAEVRRLQAEATEASKSLAEARSRCGEADNARRHMEAEATVLQGRVAELLEQVRELTQQLGEGGEASRAAADAIAAARRDTAHLQGRINELEQQLASKSEALQASERSLAGVKAEVKDWHAKADTAASELSSVRAAHDKAKREVSEKAAALEALRTGSHAEVTLAAQRLSAATQRVAELEATAAAANAAHAEAVSALQHKLTQMEKETVAARTAARQLEQQAVVRSECEAKSAEELASAQAALIKQWQARLEESAARHATAMQETQAELETVRQHAATAEEELAALRAASGDIERLRQKVADFGPLTSRLEADKAAARHAAAEADKARQQLEERVRAMEAEAAERNRKFQMLQRSFKGDLEASRQHLEAVQAQAAEAEREALQQELDAARDAAARLEASLDAQMAAAAEAAGKVAAAEARLAEERAGQAAAVHDGESLRHDFERMVAAAVAAREEEAERRVAAALQREQAAAAEARAAESRAEAAEMAKIELTLALARVDEEGRRSAAAGLATVSSLGRASSFALGERGADSPTFALHGGGAGASVIATPSPADRMLSRQADLLDDLQRRLEEAELAAAVQTRRAVSAESEVAILKEQLAEAQRQVKELTWQIKVAFGGTPAAVGRGPVGVGGAGGGAASGSGAQSAGAMGMLDILGCGANYRRN